MLRRSFALALALVGLAAGSASAQTVVRDEVTLRSQVKAAFAHAPQPASSVAAARTDGTLRLMPSAKSTLTTRAVRTTSPAQSSGKKSFFKTPWPYVIIAAVVVTVVAVAASGGSGGGY